MSRVLKLSEVKEGVDVQSLQSAFLSEKTALAPVADASELGHQSLTDECARLSRQLELAEEGMSQLRSQAETAIRDAEIRGREAGVREANDRSSDLVRRVEAGIARAIEDFNASISSLERLSPLLARESLAGIFGQAGPRPDLIGEAIRHQISKIEDIAIIRIEVSAADFGDEHVLASLCQTLGDRQVEVLRLAGMKSGDCRIKLRLGTLEVGINQQWERLSMLLRDLAEPTGGGNG